MSRDTEEYRGMSPYKATMLAEGVDEGTVDEVKAAWQYLVDTGIVWGLQGRFGRTARDLIEAGVIEEAEKS